MQPTIRRMVDAEFTEVAKIAQDELYDTTPIVDMESWLKGSGSFPYQQFFVAEGRQGETLGFIAWSMFDRFDPSVMLEIAWLVVKEEHQRKGIGRKLVNESLAEMCRYWQERHNLRVTAVIVQSDENEGARNFYRSVLAPVSETVLPGVWSKEGVIMFAKALT